MILIIIICFIIVAILIFTFKFIKVQENHIVLTESNGKFNRKLSPGLHALYFTETIKSINWIIYTQDHHSKRNRIEKNSLSYNQIPCYDIYIDIPPVCSSTIDNYTIEIDYSMTIKIIDAYKSVYSSSQVLIQIQDKIISSSRYIIQSIKISDIKGNEESILSSVKDAINQYLIILDIGIECIDLNIQDIHLDEVYIKQEFEYRDIENSAEIENMQLQKDLEFEEKNKILKEKKIENSIYLENKKLELQSKKKERGLYEIDLLLQKGFSTDEILQLKLESLRPIQNILRKEYQI